MQTMQFLHTNQISQMIYAKYVSYMHLYIYIDSNDNDLINWYNQSIKNHNSAILDANNMYFEAGFDLFVPNEIKCTYSQVNKVDSQIKCKAVMRHSYAPNQTINTGFYLYPRSSISNTPLRLANSVGIIDSSYRGKIIGKFDCKNDTYTVQKFDRLLQICAPGLVPVYVELVNSESELGTTQRGENGFGSSGR